jgi:RHS repeat-associated protein
VYSALHENENSCAGAYRYGFGGHEKDDEIKGSGNHLSFGDYGYDPRTGKRWTVDVKASKMPGWSPYAYALDNPISISDPDGEFPIYFMIRRYESSGMFGTPFISKGDDRQTSANVKSTARIHHLIGIETNTPKGSNPVFHNRARSSESTQYTPWYGVATGNPSSSASGNVLYNNDRISASNFNFSNSGKEPIASKFCESCTPAIDTKGIIGVNEFKDKGEVQIFGSVNGDNFPDAEGFIYDASGNGISLGDYQHSMYGSPMKDLWGEGSDKLLNFDITVKVDKDGNFQSASFMKDGKATPLKVYSQKETNFKAPEEEKK